MQLRTKSFESFLSSKNKQQMSVSTFSSNYFKLQVLRASDRTAFIIHLLSANISEINLVWYIMDYILCPECKTYYDSDTDCYCFLFQKTVLSNMQNKTIYFYIEKQYYNSSVYTSDTKIATILEDDKN